MIDTLLHARLQPVIESRRRGALWRRVALVWLLAALAAWALVWLQRSGSGWPRSLPAWLVVGALAATAACWLQSRLAVPDVRRLARLLEARHRDLDGRLLTAIQQLPDKKGEYSFLQDRLFEDAVRHSVDHDWQAVAPVWRVTAGRVAAGAAVAAFIAAMVMDRPPPRAVALASTRGGVTTSDGVTVTPGDASIERGTSFTVMVRFDEAVPASADLVLGTIAASERRVPLVRNLGDPVFGGTLPAVADGFTYRIDYGGKRTRDFKVGVFEYPRLERSDVELTPPAYTGLPAQRIEDTRRVSAVEGTQMAINLQLNKPVASASLVPKDGKAPPIALTTDPARAVAHIAGFPLTTSQAYELRLVDGDGRANKVPDLFVFDVVPNRPPELKLAAPRGDVRPSALEEVGFEGTAWDDFGMLAYGLAVSRGGQAPEVIELGREVPAREKAAFQHLLSMEALGAKPDELFSWYVWADDLGPDGQRRRTQGDLFFAEIRPFEEIFREGSGTEGGEPPPGEPPPGGPGSPATQLAELQKQIINATWNLQRRQPAGENHPADAAVVRDSQQQAIDQAEEAAGEVEEPMRAALWEAVTGAMDQALDKLDEATTAPSALPAALLKLRERETQVNRRQRPQPGQASSGEQQRQEQLEELDLEQAENRYETARQAQPQPSAERSAQRQVQNRLQELAQRQEDVNEKLRELQSALQTAPDEEKREELRRQLKRLEEEQRQMLADMDELRQRMDRPEAQSQMNQQRQQLDQTRQDAQRAAEAAAEGEVPQALAAGTRAQRQLQEMRDQLRKQGAGEFAEDLRQMRSEARDLARQQQEISESLGSADTPRRQSLSDSPTEEKTLQQLAEQRERTASLVERATRLSDEAEASEPLVSRQLYDSLRQFQQTDASSVKQAREELLREGVMTQRLYQQLQELQEKPQPGQALSLTTELLRAELDDPAERAARQAQAGMEQLKGGVEKAAEKVLGDDTAALQLAEKELEALAGELAQEAATARGQTPSETAAAAPDLQQQEQATTPGQTTAAAQPGEPSQAGEAGQPGEAGETGQLAQQTAGEGEATEGTAEPQATEAAAGPGRPEPRDPSSRAGADAEQAGRQASAQSPDGQPGGQESGGESGQESGQPGGQQPGEPAGRAGGSGADRESRISRLFAEGGESSGGRGGAAAPIAGEGFTNWSDRLREVEEMVEFPDLRNAVASARERARVLRQEARRDLKKPDWAVVELEILKPLVEVRQQVAEELRRRSSDASLAPIDRDPVPERFAELVRRYYEELGKDN